MSSGVLGQAAHVVAVVLRGGVHTRGVHLKVHVRRIEHIGGGSPGDVKSEDLSEVHRGAIGSEFGHVRTGAGVIVVQMMGLVHRLTRVDGDRVLPLGCQHGDTGAIGQVRGRVLRRRIFAPEILEKQDGDVARAEVHTAENEGEHHRQHQAAERGTLTATQAAHLLHESPAADRLLLLHTIHSHLHFVHHDKRGALKPRSGCTKAAKRLCESREAAVDQQQLRTQLQQSRSPRTLR